MWHIDHETIAIGQFTSISVKNEKSKFGGHVTCLVLLDFIGTGGDRGSGVVSGTKKFPFLVLIRTFFGSNFCLFQL